MKARWAAIPIAMLLLAAGLHALATRWQLPDSSEPAPHPSQVTLTPDFGYRVGDRLVVRAWVHPGQDDGLTLVADEAELPEWLELVSSRHERHGEQWEFVWVYQVFYTPRLHVIEITAPQGGVTLYVPEGQAVPLSIPPRTLRFHDHTGHPVSVEIPGADFTLSPLTVPGQPPEPDWQPPPPRWIWWPWGLVGLAGILTGGWDLAARRRRPRIFRLTLRQLQKMDDPKAIFLAVHRALDAKAGRSVLTPRDLTAAWPMAEQAQHELERFFQASHGAFYGKPQAQDSPGPAGTRHAGKDLAIRLCKALDKLERWG